MKKKGKKKMLAMACLAAVGMMPQSAALAAEGVERFRDVAADAWYAPAVDFCQAQEWMGGTEWEYFSPDEPISRATLAVILHRQAGSPAATTSMAYQDVAEDAWYREAIDWVSEKYFISGYGEGYFGPDDLVTRQQLAIIIWRYAGHPDSSEGIADYADQAQIADAAQEAVRWAKETELLGGLENSQFQPDSLATRAQVAAVMYRYWDLKDQITKPEAVEETADDTDTEPVEPATIAQPQNDATPTQQAEPEQATQPAQPTTEAKDDAEQTEAKVAILIGDKQYTATLVENEATKLLLERLPMTVRMNEMNGNEKYIYLPQALVMQAEKPGQIHNGDLMLYGSDCLVLFYKDFTTAYSYTRLGSVDDSEGLASALGLGPVEVTFQLAE